MNLISRFKCKLIALLVGILGIFGEILWLGALAILVVKLATLLPVLSRLLSWPPSSPWQSLLCVLLSGFLALAMVYFLPNLILYSSEVIGYIIKLPLVVLLIPLRLTFSYIRNPHKWGHDWKYERLETPEAAEPEAKITCNPESCDHVWGPWEWNCWDYDHDWFESTCLECGKIRKTHAIDKKGNAIFPIEDE